MSKQTLLVAVSGGVDSVVLLDLMMEQIDRAKPVMDRDIVVAHVDHGIRDDSAADARFVEALAQQYHVPFVGTKYALGASASEDAARQARYEFLFAEADRHSAVIVTAHHRDDMVETIAINLMRGTGWRGLAVMNTPGVIRPLLGWTKQQIYDYALLHRLEWVEDSTNRSDDYLRNRVRKQVHQYISPSQAETLQKYHREQVARAAEIDELAETLVSQQGGSRYFYTMIDMSAAVELLRLEVARASGKRPTRLQAERAVLAIRAAAPGTQHDIGGGVRLQFSLDRFVVVTHL